MATLLVASFHNRPQLLHFSPDTASLTLETLNTPEFQDYTWISKHPFIKGLFYALQRYSDKQGILSIVGLSSNTSSSLPSSSSKPPSLEIIKSYPSHGMDPCHLGLSSNTNKLAIANVNTSFFSLLSDEAKERFLSSSPTSLQYDSSTVTIYTLNTEDGMIDEDIPPTIYDLAKSEGASFKIGPDNARQEAPHPHGCFYVDSLGCFLVPDLGSDKLRLLGGGDGNDRPVSCKRGAGPRHAAINPEASIAYVVNELQNTISVHDLSSSSSSNKNGPLYDYSILPSDVKLSSASQMNAAAISITPDYKFIYVTNRLESHPEGDAIVYFKITDEGRKLERIGEIRTGLDHPRAAEIFACNEKGHAGKQGLYYVVGSKTEKGAVVYEINRATGELQEVARNNEVIQSSGFAVI